ncbi:MAG: hypothetical protein ISN29_02055 [Gammaproteobacteria bacterium AqS3]|nr:hypothetical protein [Gammaproteobacteria bacterium AqS3]
MTAKQQRPQGKGKVEKVEAVDSSTAIPPMPERKVRTGDVVLYAQVAARSVVGFSDFVMLPVIVTRVHNDDCTIDGVMFATGDVNFTGARCIYNIDKGDAEGKYQFMGAPRPPK